MYTNNFINPAAVLHGVAKNLAQGWDYGAPPAPYINVPPDAVRGAVEIWRRAVVFFN